MKAAAFDLVTPPNLAAAAGDADSRPLAGGQSLGPMLNFRVVRPARLIDVGHLVELVGVEETDAAVTLGAAITHAAIEDGRVPDIGQAILARVAGGIAYRAVRNRGTIGGSLCHADPAADWVTVCTALGATLKLTSSGGQRTVTMAEFIRGAYQTVLQPGELLQAVRIPRLVAGARWSYVKQCRKPGEFAHAMAAVLRQPDGQTRVVIGALGTAPLLIEHAATIDAAVDLIPGDPVFRHISRANLLRAWNETVAG